MIYVMRNHFLGKKAHELVTIQDIENTGFTIVFGIQLYLKFCGSHILTF